jgi:hypothetical protein
VAASTAAAAAAAAAEAALVQLPRGEEQLLMPFGEKLKQPAASAKVGHQIDQNFLQS